MPTGPRKPARALLSMSFWRWETPRDPTAALRSGCPRGWTGPKSGLSLGSGGAAAGRGGGLLPFVCGHQMWGQPILGGPHTAPGRESDCHPPEDVTSAHTTSPTRMTPGQARLEPRLLPRALPLEHPEPKDCHALWPSAGKQPPGNKQRMERFMSGMFASARKQQMLETIRVYADFLNPCAESCQVIKITS